VTDQFTVDTNEYQRRIRREIQSKRRKAVTKPHTGEWTAAEDAIILREDITLVEKMAMTQRYEGQILHRLKLLNFGAVKDCGYCGQPTLRLPTQRFCGHTCARAAERKAKVFDCPVCGKQEMRAPSKADNMTYCSRECSGVANRSAERWERTSTCPQCGDTFTISLGRDANGKRRYSKRKHCSKECLRASQQKIPLSLACPVCKKDFKPKLWHQKLCSTKCAGQLSAERAAEKKRMNCKQCGVEFVPAQLVNSSGTLRQFCSRKCFGLAHRKLPDSAICTFCEKEYAPKTTVQRVCSRECNGRRAYSVHLKGMPHTQPQCFKCQVDGCENPGPFVRNWCRKHYGRFWTKGSAEEPTLWVKNRPEKCSIKGCGRPHSARGWCSTHHTRWRLKGDPLAHIPIRQQARRPVV
jgi:hypothetical protein